MSAHVLLNISNELGKSDKIRAWKPSILSLFCNKFNKYHNTGARMLDGRYTYSGLSILFHGVKSLLDATLCDKPR